MSHYYYKIVTFSDLHVSILSFLAFQYFSDTVLYAYSSRSWLKTEWTTVSTNPHSPRTTCPYRLIPTMGISFSVHDLCPLQGILGPSIGCIHQITRLGHVMVMSITSSTQSQTLVIVTKLSIIFQYSVSTCYVFGNYIKFSYFLHMLVFLSCSDYIIAPYIFFSFIISHDPSLHPGLDMAYKNLKVS